MGKQWKRGQISFSWAPKSLQMVTAVMKLKHTCFLGRLAMTNLDSVLKSRDITLLTEFHIVKAMVFPVVMYEYESWTTKKAECRRIDAFKLWCSRRLLRIIWAARRLNQSILKEINPEYSLKRLMLKLKFQYLATWGEKNWLIGKDPDAGKYWGQEEKKEMVDEMDNITDSRDMSINKHQEIVKDRESFNAAVHEITKSWTWLRNWTTTIIL